MGALLYKKKAMKINTILGIHDATKGLIVPLTAKEELTVINRIYPILNTRPIPILSPIPPFTLRADSDAPIIVRIKAENTDANLE